MANRRVRVSTTTVLAVVLAVIPLAMAAHAQRGGGGITQGGPTAEGPPEGV